MGTGVPVAPGEGVVEGTPVGTQFPGEPGMELVPVPATS